MNSWEQPDVPLWLILIVWLGVGLYFLGRWEGWWKRLSQRRNKPKKERLHSLICFWCGQYKAGKTCDNCKGKMYEHY